MHLDTPQPTTEVKIIKPKEAKDRTKKKQVRLLAAPLLPSRKQKDPQTFLHLVRSLMLPAQLSKKKRSSCVNILAKSQGHDIEVLL